LSLVEDAVAQAQQAGRPVARAAQARALIGLDRHPDRESSRALAAPAKK
jgi:hypothetical protein